MNTKKKKGKLQKKISRYNLTNGRMTKEQEDFKKSLTGQGLTRKALWNGQEEVKLVGIENESS